MEARLRKSVKARKSGLLQVKTSSTLTQWSLRVRMGVTAEEISLEREATLSAVKVSRA